MELEKLYNEHKDLISKIANSIIINNTSIISKDDLMQAGACGLISCIKSYDPSYGSFKKYASRCIRNALIEQANSFSNIFTVDEKTRRSANKVFKLKKMGMLDKDIMIKLGIKKYSTYKSLLDLVTIKSINLDDLLES